MTRAPLLALLVLAFLAAPAAHAATLSGRVKDPTGAGLPGVTIEVTARDAKPLVVNTDAAGGWRVDVPAGAYDASFRLISFTSVTRRGIDVREPATQTADVVLSVEASASIVVTGKRTFHNLADIDQPVDDLIGVADAASVGVITAKQIDARPTQRAADILETVPGVVISQHSGEGKANQYYLRGFNLDHGTDLAATVAGAPVNMPTHAHGQGYSDENFLIPELISGVQYKKGPYYADEGDFASAGAININYMNALDRPLVSVTGGSFGYQRVLAAGSHPWLGGILLGALEAAHDDGPWVHHDAYRKLNGLVRFTGGGDAQAFSITASAYNGRWNATDQIPDRALSDGLSRYGDVDPTDGGHSHRYSLVGDWQRGGGASLTKATAYVIGYGLDLFSNFTYFLDDPVHGDQFEQQDRRVVSGVRATHQWLAGRTENMIGLDVRRDQIGALALYHTEARERLETVRSDRLAQTSGGLFAQSSIQWTDRVRTVIGLRGDEYDFGGTRASIASPKLSVILRPWNATEAYVSAGSGFHSNDGRSARDGTPLVRTRGAELGLRTTAIPRLQSTVALWALDIGSELVFAGDAGTTEASMASRRTGVEWSNYVHVSDHVVFDADLAYSRARFRNGDRIPGAVEGVVSSGISLYDAGPFNAALRYRYLGARPLVEDNSVRSRGSSTFNADVSYAFTPRVRFGIEALNLTNARASDVDYFYTSRLPGEPAAGIDDVHTHPIEPRSIRITIATTW